MNLPNKLTMARVCMIPIFVLFLLTDIVPYSNYVAVVIFIVACLTDALDGYIARKYNLISNFGKFMDPLADKLLVCAAFICFVQLQLIPAWIIIVIISREFIISGFRLVASDNGVVIAASWWGKFKTTAQMIMSILLIVNFDGVFFNTLEQIFIYVALALTVISLIDYLIKNKNVLTEGSK
ncbi:CDP-diacylglycerol--glycerol-3-phosphate 3-phosphatidyltransferase [Anaerosporobacter sp.]|uniref:CDP-diacylglycerol--glycerol-3-phosphate 3-phosphatidyltransferase n=1 Tax=Anaerosporobacter sp. TaxID=1872529 RepID=UPI00286FA440|nr:CDP-diacylglycerol--glycerol-3-phosphate 3-phosphatidyltransferase [Anaerosporobacter sp.]